MHRLLREHAAILRSQAEELEQVAEYLESKTGIDGNYGPVTSPTPSFLDPDDLPGDMTIAVPDGTVDSTYMLTDLVHVNEEATLRAAKHEALQGKIVRLDYGEGDPRNTIWTKETFANEQDQST